MHDPDHLKAEAEAILGSKGPVLAAGIFGLHDTFAATALASLAGAQVGKSLLDNPAAPRTGGAVAIHATRDAAAAAQGLTVRMVVAVTEHHLYILDWRPGSGPSRVLVSLDRATTEVVIKRLGMGRRITLHDRRTDQLIPLTGTTAFFSSVAEGDRSVLAMLGTRCGPGTGVRPVDGNRGPTDRRPAGADRREG